MKLPVMKHLLSTVAAWAILAFSGPLQAEALTDEAQECVHQIPDRQRPALPS
jgi:hypothetical protein